MKNTISFVLIFIWLNILSIYTYSQSDSVKHFRHIGDLELVRDSMPSRINESSGLIFFREKLWTHNDSGDGPYIYVLDSAAQKILQIITVENAKNVDWEEITQDSAFIYMCDFGNNYGLRNNLTIYKINKSDIPDSGNVSVNAEKIEFSYKNKPAPSVKLKRSQYDMEAMICYHDTLVLFSKNWEKPYCNIYFIPAKAGIYEIEPIKTIYLNGLVTAASLSPNQKQLLLLGYHDYVPFVFLLNDFSLQNIQVNEAIYRRYDAKFCYQTEGIAFVKHDEAYISCERNILKPNSVFRIRLLY